MTHRTTLFLRASWLRVAFLTIAVAIFSPGTAAGTDATPKEPAPVAQASLKFREARRLIDLGQFDRACQLFDESQKLASSPGTLLNIGNCREQKHQLLGALEAFQQAKKQAQRHSNAEASRIWLKAVAGRIEGLLARLSALRLVPSATAGTQILLNGNSLLPGETPTLLEPGRHTVVVKAEGYKTSTQELLLAEGQQLELKLPPLVPLHSYPPAQRAQAGNGALDSNNTSKESKYESTPLWLMGGGTVLGSAGIVTLLLRQSEEKELDKLCDENGECDEGYEPHEKKAEALLLTSRILLGVGAVIAGVGLTLYLLEFDSAEEVGGATLSLKAQCTLASCGLSAAGHF